MAYADPDRPAARPIEARALPLVTGALALGVYLLTLAPDLTWAYFGGDGGELIAAAVTLGIPHPPGYPLYVLLGKLFSLLPVDPPALRLHLLSAGGAALAAGCATAAALALQASPPQSQSPAVRQPLPRSALSAALAAGLCAAFAPLVWRQALIAEVYTLNLAIVGLLVWAVATKRPLWLRGLLFGLSLTTHLTSALLLPLLLLTAPPRRWWQMAAGTLPGLLPWAALPLLARGDSPVVWGDPLTLRGWWWLVSGALYRPNVFGVSVAELGRRLGAWTGPLLSQFTYLGAPLLLTVPFLALPAMRRYVAGSGVAALLFTAYAFGYAKPDALNALLPALLLLSILLTFPLSRIGHLSLLLPLLLLTLHFSDLSLHEERALRPLTSQALERLPENAVILSTGDPTTFTLWYFQHVEGRRPDVIVVDSQLLAFDWYRRRLERAYPTLEYLAEDDVAGFVAENRRNRPVCHLQLEPALFDCRTLTPPSAANENAQSP